MGERVTPPDDARSRRDRAVIFTDSSSPHAQFLTAALLAAGQSIEGFAIAAVVDTGAVDGLTYLWSFAAWLLARLFDPAFHKPRPCAPRRLRVACRKADVPYYVADKGDSRAWDLRANILISIYCMKKFSAAFLERFDYAVNYHNGPLPAYRGVLATNWELYRGEPRFGFTFHRLSQGIDEGNLLASGSVRGDGCKYKFEIERLKTFAAASHWPDVIEKISGRDDGEPQAGDARLYTRKDARTIREVVDPGSIVRSDLERRIRCFESVRISLVGRELPVSAIAPSAGGSRFDFVTADGAALRAVRFDHFPYVLYRVGRMLARVGRIASAPLRRRTSPADKLQRPR